MPKLRLVAGDTPRSKDLLDAAGRLFRRKGFADTTVREIARAAGVWPGSLHYRYPTKDALLLALMERGIGTGEAALRDALVASDDPIVRLRLAVRTHISVLIKGDDAIYVLLYERRALQGEARVAMTRLRDRYDSLWDGILYQAAGTGRFRHDVELKLVRLFLLGASNWVPQWYSPQGGLTPEAIADALTDVFLRGVLKPTKPHRRRRE